METLALKAQELLQSRFPGCVASFEWEDSLSKVGGEITWDGFDGMDMLDRQTLLWSILREHLSEEEQHAFTLIYTFTPAEELVMAEG